MSDKSGEFVVKPCKQSEVDFYESATSHKHFKAYIPNHMGVLSLGTETQAAQIAAAIIVAADSDPQIPLQPQVPNIVETAWAPSGGAKIQTDVGIVLENVVADFKKPNILDVKLGARLWANDAPPAKRAKLEKEAEETTSKRLGLRIAGMKIFKGFDFQDQDPIASDGYKLYNKQYGRSFCADTIHQGFEEYFHLLSETTAGPHIRETIRRFIEDLKCLAEVIEHEESRMYSASLLFVYEGDLQALGDAFAEEKAFPASLESAVLRDTGDIDGLPNSTRGDSGYASISNGESFMMNGNSHGHGMESDIEEDGAVEDEEVDEVNFPSIQSLKLIDFAHAQWTPGQGPDENLLHGIKNVIKILTDLIN